MFLLKIYFLYLVGLLYKALMDILEKVKKKKEIPCFKPKLIVFSRSDRIGDAISTLPFFLALKGKFRIVVLTSEENNWVISPFVKTKVIKLQKRRGFLGFLQELFSFFRKGKTEAKDGKIFFDLQKSPILSCFFNKKGYFCVHCKSLFLNLCCSDYVIDDFYSTFGKKQLIEKYLSFFEDCGIHLQVEEFPKEVDEYIQRVHHSEAEEFVEKLDKFAIVFVGNKSFRNFEPNEWKILIERGLEYNGNILIVDDPAFRVLPYLRKFLNRRSVYFLEKKFDLWTLMYIAKFADWVVGIDGGGFNFLQMPTNAYQINFYTDVETWKPFSNNPYVLEDKFGNTVLISSVTSQGKKKKVLYVDDSKKVFCEKLEKDCEYVRKRLIEYVLERKIKLE